MSLQKAYEIVSADSVVTGEAHDAVAMTYDQRLLRRKKLTTSQGEGFYVDLPKTVSVVAGQGFLLADGRIVVVEAAHEALLAITGPDLLRYAWHIGNRHTPCELTSDQLIIQRDPVLKAMLLQLGAKVRDIEAPFTPEGGAYGHGRTMGHDHGEHIHGTETGSAHAHSHAGDHTHGHHHD